MSINQQKAVAVAKEWLRSKGCTLWMDWDISSEDGLEAAAVWIVTAMDELMDFYEEHLEGSLDW